MQILTRLTPIAGASAVTIGNFDGYHLGHRANIEKLLAIARQHRLHTILLTFNPHPRRHFSQPFALIQTPEQKLTVLQGLALDTLFNLPFADIVNIPADTFVTDVLIARWQTKFLIVGDDFRFGADRQGNVGLLSRAAEKLGFTLLITPTITLADTRVSSSTIRKLLAAGQIEAANRLMVAPYTMTGQVVKGEQVGREIGFPTINLATGNEIVPEGVFQTEVVWRGVSYPALTSIGTRPTFNGLQRTVETHIVGFQGDLYDEYLSVRFHAKIRDQVKFASVAELVAQIKRDIEHISFDMQPHF
jgi:riboflavin kinase / FMN adenylyltransferase